ncbi:MAG: sigma-70 family RNA polymerase sigma factor [Chloroflexota bacterium]
MRQTTHDELSPQIIAQARRGDANAFGQLVQRYQSPVYNLAYRLLGDAAEAEDAAQETFLRAYQQLRAFDAERRFTPWLLSIATHYCIDRLRRRKFVGPSLDADDLRDQFTATTPEPEAATLAREDAEQAQQLLNHLSPPSRAVVVLKYWNDLSLDEIATVTGDSVGAVKVKLHRARQAMAKASQDLRGFPKPHRSETQGATSHAR